MALFGLTLNPPITVRPALAKLVDRPLMGQSIPTSEAA